MRGTVILLGAPGSGKGTQARLLGACLGVPHISTGDILRERIGRGDGVAGVEKIVRSGSLVPDEVVNGIVDRRLDEPDAQAGFVLDGYPRTEGQAEHLAGRLGARGVVPVVIHLLVDYNILIGRLSGRRQCPCCGAVYNVVSHPPKVAGVCDADGCSLVIRQDDSESVIRERLEAYERQTVPLAGFFGRRGWLHEIEAGNLPADAVFEKICRSIRNE